jgi:hypothetical protein
MNKTVCGLSLCAGLTSLLLAADASTKKDPFTARQRAFWSFQKVKRTDPRAVQDAAWARNPIDTFILAKLESKGLRPNPAADRITLLRRVSFDLIGLPPTPEETQVFLADTSPDAYEKAVDRLLDSPQYGERWARHWLDLARYAESEGFKSDETRPNAWRYRDYVIQAFNSDKPYDRFVQEQIAGDELFPHDPQAHIATAFNRHYPDESNARNLMQRRQEILNDVTDTAGSVFMGLTYGCARCHNHKFDPILQADYYRLQAFFANTAADDAVPVWSEDRVAAHRKKLAEWEAQTDGIRKEIAALLESPRQALIKELFDKYPPEIQAAIVKPASERNPFEWQMYYKAKPYLEFDDETASKKLRAGDRKKYELLRAELARFDGINPGELPVGIGMKDLGRVAPATHVLAVGVYDAKQEEVEPGFLTILDPNPPRIVAPHGIESTGRRAALARWLTDPDNPLPARVMVNRIWHYHFGRGLVGTPSDFGIMGERPSHPELLDWLASEFVRGGWGMKRMHRLIVTSNTYRQVSTFQAAAAKADPSNRLLWAFPRQRLEGEVIRDASLRVAGLLNMKMGGPSVFPELPDGMPPPRGGWKLSTAEERNRRSIYIFVRRNARYPMLETFDMPDTHESCARRMVTTTAPQALTMLNNKVSLDWARAFAAEVLSVGEPARQIERAYLLAYARAPDSFEKDTVASFLHKQRSLIAGRAARGEKLALPEAVPAGIEPAYAAAMVDFCHMLLNSNEFVYRN